MAIDSSPYRAKKALIIIAFILLIQSSLCQDFIDPEPNFV